jgi:hypothetical protein
MGPIATAGATAGADLLKTLLAMEIEKDKTERQRIQDYQREMRTRQQEAMQTQLAMPQRQAQGEQDALARIIQIFQAGRR